MQIGVVGIGAHDVDIPDSQSIVAIDKHQLIVASQCASWNTDDVVDGRTLDVGGNECTDGQW